MRLLFIEDFTLRGATPMKCALLKRGKLKGERVISTGINPEGWRPGGMVQFSEAAVEQLGRHIGMIRPEQMKELRLKYKAAMAKLELHDAVVAAKDAEIRALQAALELAEAVRDDAVLQFNRLEQEMKADG